MPFYNGHYYYIPCDAARAFRDLILQTTLQRGFNAALAAYPVTVVNAVPIPPQREDTTTAIITFNAKVPNGNGRLIVTLTDGRKVTISAMYISPNDKVNNKDGVKMGDPIDHLLSQWNPIDKHLNPENLKNAKGQFYSDDFPPALTSIDTTLKCANNNLESIRANTSIITLKAFVSMMPCLAVLHDNRNVRS